MREELIFSAEDRAAIEELQTAWVTAELEGRSAALLELCTAAPIWLPPDEAPLCGRTTILEWLKRQDEVALRRIEIGDVAISGRGPFAWKVATFRTTFESPAHSGPRTISGTHTWLLQRDGAAGWRIAVVAWTAAGTAPA